MYNCIIKYSLFIYFLSPLLQTREEENITSATSQLPQFLYIFSLTANQTGGEYYQSDIVASPVFIYLLSPLLQTREEENITSPTSQLPQFLYIFSLIANQTGGEYYQSDIVASPVFIYFLSPLLQTRLEENITSPTSQLLQFLYICSLPYYKLDRRRILLVRHRSSASTSMRKSNLFSNILEIQIIFIILKSYSVKEVMVESISDVLSFSVSLLPLSMKTAEPNLSNL